MLCREWRSGCRRRGRCQHHLGHERQRRRAADVTQLTLWRYSAGDPGERTRSIKIEHPEAGETAEVSNDEDEYLRLLGERIHGLRVRRGMTRKILSRDSSVSLRYLAQLEAGEGNISIIRLRHI